MNIKEHFSEHATLWIMTGALSALGFLVWLGAMTYLDTRHIQRVEWYSDKIDAIDSEINDLKLYNQFGNPTLAPAREQIILQKESRKESLERRLSKMDKD